MIACLKNDQPAGSVSFVFHEDGPPSALDDPDTADVLTRAMADRARNVAPFLAEQLDLSGARCLVDVGGGHGLYSFALLKAQQDLQANIIDREPALAVAEEYAHEHGVADRVQLLCGDIHAIGVPNSTIGKVTGVTDADLPRRSGRGAFALFVFNLRRNVLVIARLSLLWLAVAVPISLFVFRDACPDDGRILRDLSDAEVPCHFGSIGIYCGLSANGEQEKRSETQATLRHHETPPVKAATW